MLSISFNSHSEYTRRDKFSNDIVIIALYKLTVLQRHDNNFSFTTQAG